MNSEEVLKFLRELGQDEIISKFNRVSLKSEMISFPKLIDLIRFAEEE